MISLFYLENLIQSGKIHLLGQIEIDDEEFEELKKYSIVRISYLTSNTAIHDLKLSVFLVQVAIREYKEGRYWPCLSEVIGETLHANKQNYLGQVFLKTLQRYNLFMLQERENGTRVFVENIKAHAVVTNWYLDGFFDFSYAYYENNLFRQIYEDIENDFSDLSLFMKTTLSGDKDYISESGSNTHAARSYRLLKSTRAVIAQADPDLLKELLFPTLKLIDDTFRGDEISQGKDRFEDGFIKWMQKPEVSEKSEKKVSARSGERRLYSQRPYIMYNRKSERFELVIPKQKFRSDDCKGVARISVSYRGQEKTQDLELYKSFGIYISEEIRMPIYDIFENIKVTITSEICKEYAIASSVYRILNSSWEGVRKLSNGHNHLFVQKGNEVTLSDESCLVDTWDDEFWTRYDINVTSETVCFVNSLILSTIGEFSPKPSFDKPITNFDVILDEEKVLATRTHPVVSFFVSQEKLKGTYLDINEKKYQLKSFSDVSVAKWPQDNSIYAVTLRLDGSIIQKDGYYTIRLDIPNEPIRELTRYVLLNQFDCRVTNNIYVYADTGAITLYPYDHEYEADLSWEKREFPDGSVKYYFPIENEQYVDIGLKLQNKQFCIRNTLKTFAYGFSRESLTSKKADYIWYKDLRESLYVRLPGATDVSIHLGNDVANKVLAEEIETGFFRADISSLVYEINREKSRRVFFINVDYTTYRKKWVTLPIIYRKPFVSPYFLFDYSEEEGITSNVSIQGKADIYLTIKDHKTHDVIIDRKHIVNGKNYFNELSVEGYYDLEPVMVEADDFFSVDEEPLKSVFGAGIVSFDDLSNCRLPLAELIYQEEEMPLGELTYFVNVQEKKDENTYIGALKSRKKDSDKTAEKSDYCGKVQLTVYRSDPDMTVSLLFYSIQEEEYSAPFYDKYAKCIVRGDSEAVMKSKEYTRYLILDEDDSEFVVNTQGIRRYR